MKNVMLCLCLGLILCLSACASYRTNEAVVSRDDTGVIRFVGEPYDLEVFLNEVEVGLDRKPAYNIFELKPGSYELEIRRGDRVLEQKLIMINRGQTTEVRLP
ncbi:MAG TPA: hypothetical protein P5533_01750 [Candidatus Cloacimonadota bacterium]|nr:hypothetical protein [Candidatus Cloacimonadota bacterium]